MDDDAVLTGHMRATVRLREIGLQQAHLNREVLDGLMNIATHDHRPELVKSLRHHRDATTKQLEEAAETQYQRRLLYYALCAMESDHSLTPDEAIAHVESLVLEAAICA
jgi:hypothetical protein